MINIINARDGKEHLKPGDTFADPYVIFADPHPDPGVPMGFQPMNDDLQLRLVSVQDNILSASIVVEAPWGEQKSIPLTVRLFHPAFLLQRVGFIPT